MWPFSQFFGKAKPKRTQDVEVPGVASEVMDAFAADDDETPLEGRKGHKGQFVRAVGLRRWRNRIGASSRKFNRKRRKMKKTGKKFKI
jgi:hypothetical protein